MKNATFLLFLFTSFLLSSQQMKISGTVSDVNGTPLPGTNVIVKGTTRGVSTDFDGNYSINAKKGEALEFSYLGFKPQTVTIQNQTTINISLKGI